MVCCEMTRSNGNVSVVLLEKECNTDKRTIVEFIDAKLDLGFNMTLSTFCNQDALKLESLFSDNSVNVFLGAMDYGLHNLVLKYADLNQRPIITPYGTPNHLHHQRNNVFSLGSSFESISIALRLVLTEFRWTNIVILAEIEEHVISLATAMFVELTHERFEPKISYIPNFTEDSTLNAILENIQSEHKGKCYL